MPGYGLIDTGYAVRLRAAAAGSDGPVYMLGLTKFRAGTGTAAMPDHAPVPILASVGATVCLAASVVASSPDWDGVGVVGYPSRRSFIDLAYQPEFLDWHAAKEPRVERATVLGLLPSSGGLPATDCQRILLEVWNGPEPAPVVTGPATSFEVEGTIVGDGRHWSGVRYTPIEPGTALPLLSARFGYQALLLEPTIQRWR